MPEHSPAPTFSRGVYGFVVYLLFSTLFVLYVLWAFIPDEIFEKIGITELPNKYFALFIPILILNATTLFAFLIYPSISFIMTPNIDSTSTITDSNALRRCHRRDSDNLMCDNKILSDSNSWKVPEMCENHQNQKAKIANFCDCTEKNKCLLQINKNHVEMLRKKENFIKNSCDLDIHTVSKILYEE
jgi:phosphatidylinositol N-acetylglucosaminyltransferase subunit P